MAAINSTKTMSYEIKQVADWYLIINPAWKRPGNDAGVFVFETLEKASEWVKEKLITAKDVK